MKRFTTWTIGMLLSILSIGGVYAQNVEMKGVVSSTDRTPIPYATVVAKGSNTLWKGAVTDEKGLFKLTLPAMPDSVEVRCLGFEEKRIAFREMADTLYLSPLSSELDEIVVQGKRPMIKMQGSTMQVRIHGTPLARENRISDLLRKIPGLMVRNETISTVEGHIPSIYVNGKKVSGIKEIKNIDIKSIESIHLETSPGARYNSSETAVLLIKTTSRWDGLSLVAQSSSRVNHHYSHDNSIDFSYRKDFSRFFGGVGYSDYRRHSLQNIISHIQDPQTHIHSILDGVLSGEKEWVYHAGMEYAKGQWEVGVQYNGSSNQPYAKTQSCTEAFLKHSNDTIVGQNNLNDRRNRHHLNSYAQYQWSEQWRSELHFDFFTTQEKREQEVEEKFSTTGTHNSLFNNRSTYTMLSVKPIWSYRASDHLSFEWGGEYLNVLGESNQFHNQDLTSEYRTRETTISGFGLLKTRIKKVNLQGGIRYENMRGYIHNQLDPEQNLSPSSSHWLADFSASTQLGETLHSLSLKNTIERPLFGWLNNFSYYSDHYTSQSGNPTLKPARSYLVQYKFFYKFIYAALGYTHTQDYIGVYLYNPENNPQSIGSTWVNYHANHRFQATLNLNHAFDFYHPSLTTSLIVERVKDKRLQNVSIPNIPLCYIDWNNDFSLPGGVSLSIEYVYTGKASSRFFIFEPTHVVNVGINRSFLNGALDLSIRGKDLFRGNINRYSGYFGNVQFSQVEDQDRRSLSLDLTWRFNQNKHRYKGQSASETINRF